MVAPNHFMQLMQAKTCQPSAVSLITSGAVNNFKSVNAYNHNCPLPKRKDSFN